MTDADSLERAIGVGMGGSCPNCRAAVDLGQEFCLECGAPIRLLPEKPAGRGTRAANPGTAAAVAAMAPKQKGFPWVPFLVVLGLVTIGVVFALVSGGDNASTKHKKAKSKKSSTSALSSTPSTNQQVVPGCNGASTGSTGSTTTPATPTTSPTNPASPSTATGLNDLGVNTATANDGSVDPTAGDGSGGVGSASSVPGSGTSSSTFPSTGTSGATATGSTGSTTPVLVDEHGNLCPAGTTAPGTSTTTPTPTTTNPGTSSTVPPVTSTDNSSSTSTPPISTDSGSTSGSTSTTTPSTSAQVQSWPAGRSGYTIALANYAQATYSESEARQRAEQAIAKDISAGVLDSNAYTSLHQDLWVVFHGIYSTEAEATADLSSVRSSYPGAVVRKVTP